jgi:hypothetical protein
MWCDGKFTFALPFGGLDRATPKVQSTLRSGSPLSIFDTDLGAIFSEMLWIQETLEGLNMYRYTMLALALILGLISVLAAALAQAQVQGTVAPGQVQGNHAPPLFRGIMVDATGQTVGRIYINALLAGNAGGGAPPAVHMVIRQIDGVWVGLPVTDFTSGFNVSDRTALLYLYQSADCTGQAYLPVSNNVYVWPAVSANLFVATSSAPPIALVATVPPSTEPYIYFAGTPALVTINSLRREAGTDSNGQCNRAPATAVWVGPIQSVPVSSLGLTLPFDVR